jgi:RNA polymerase sigma factor (sigma-70 family)
MTDCEIVELYWQRDEEAIAATRDRYQPYLFRIAFQILAEISDSEECVNDTYLGAWNSMPPHRPTVLQTYLGKLTRRIAIDRYRKNSAGKRGGGEVTQSLEELQACLPAQVSVEQEIERRELTAAMDQFLRTLSPEKRRVFLLRYWYSLPIAEISALMGFRDSKTVNMLSRIRKALKVYLEQEDVFHGSIYAL